MPWDAFNAQVGAAVRTARVAADVTQESLGDAIGLTRTSIVNIEKGNQGMMLRTVLDIAVALDVHPSVLVPDFDGAPKATRPPSDADLRRRIRALERRLERIAALAEPAAHPGSQGGSDAAT